MSRVSKYAIDPSIIFRMEYEELKQYIRGGYKTIESKIRRTKRSEYSDFSELLQDLEMIEGRVGHLSGSVRGLTLQQMRNKALGISQLFRISETPAQLEREGYDNIKNFFKEPRFTRRFIEGIHRNQTMLKKLANKNDKFIRDILGSEQISMIVEENEGDDQEMYRKLLIATSDVLDMYEDDEKEAALQEWDSVYTYQGDQQWSDDEGIIVDVYSEWKWGI